MVTGFFTVAGSMLGNVFGAPALFAGALAGGVAGVVASVQVALRLAWLAPPERRGAIVGGIVGFGVAAPIAALNLHSPIAPLASCALVGAGVLFGAGFARRA